MPKLSLNIDGKATSFESEGAPTRKRKKPLFLHISSLLLKISRSSENHLDVGSSRHFFVFASTRFDEIGLVRFWSKIFFCSTSV